MTAKKKPATKKQSTTTKRRMEEPVDYTVVKRKDGGKK